MELFKRTVIVVPVLAALAAGTVVVSGQGRNQIVALAPKPTTLTPYVAPHRPVWRLQEILDQHAGQKSWTHAVVDDNLLKAEYIAMGPGERTPTRFYADNRAWWIVQDGQIRFEIDGQEPFVASKGFLVQVPYRVPFRMETVGDTSSLRFEVSVAGASLLYPVDAGDTPAPVDGATFVPVLVRERRGTYDERNQPYLDFLGEVVGGTRRGGAFVSDERGFANIIRGRGAPPPPDTDLGHFHLDYAEFWFILEGQIDYLIEGVPFFSAHQGDVVYVPKGRYHRATYGGDGMATRLAINGYPVGLHNWPAPAE